jgi:hypothetical protein
MCCVTALVAAVREAIRSFRRSLHDGLRQSGVNRLLSKYIEPGLDMFLGE